MIKFEKEKSLEVMIIGPGMEEFEPVREEYTKIIGNQGFHFHFGMGFSAPEITNVMINFGVSVFGGVSVFIISELIKKIFVQKKEAEKKVYRAILQ